MFPIETELEADGRWIADIPQVPGAMAYGATKEEAIKKAVTIALSGGDKVKMFYFGPWDRAGHFLHDDRGNTVYGEKRGGLPWGDETDGGLQPHFADCRKRRSNSHYCGCGSGPEGHALIHHKDGWTALSFWDRSVDTRGACNSTYFAEGTFTFLEMARMAKERFAERWSKHNFVVVNVTLP